MSSVIPGSVATLLGLGLWMGFAPGTPVAHPLAPRIAMSLNPEPPFVPTLAIDPPAVSLVPQATQAFQATINYPEGVRYIRQPVRWRVLETDGGTITAVGLYTAPKAPGTYHVEARREDFKDVVATATVTVQ